MSPEQSEGRIDDMGPASDVYSLGATLYTILTGKEPFESTIVGVILGKVQTGDFVPPRERTTGVPRALDAVCLKAMSLLPKDRYPSCAALASDIEHWLADEPVTALRDPLSDRTIRWIKRHRVLTATACRTNDGRGDQSFSRHCPFGQSQSRDSSGSGGGKVAAGPRAQERGVAEAQRQVAEDQSKLAETERRRADRAAEQAERARAEADKNARQAKAEADHANRVLYSRQIADAQHEWEVGDVAAAWGHLNSCRVGPQELGVRLSLHPIQPKSEDAQRAHQRCTQGGVQPRRQTDCQRKR